jgi:hypothetical protein
LMAISANQEIASSDEISSPVAGLNVLSQEPALARTRALLFIRGASLGNFEAPNGATNDNGKLSLWAARGTKFNSSDPSLTAVSTAYPTPPFLPVFHKPIKLASRRPCGHLHLNRRIDLSAIRFGALLHLVVAEVHIRLEHAYHSGGREPHQRAMLIHCSG